MGMLRKIFSMECVIGKVLSCRIYCMTFVITFWCFSRSCEGNSLLLKLLDLKQLFFLLVKTLELIIMGIAVNTLLVRCGDYHMQVCSVLTLPSAVVNCHPFMAVKCLCVIQYFTRKTSTLVCRCQVSGYVLEFCGHCTAAHNVGSGLSINKRLKFFALLFPHAFLLASDPPALLLTDRALHCLVLSFCLAHQKCSPYWTLIASFFYNIITERVIILVCVP